MARLIDADALIEELNKLAIKANDLGEYSATNFIINLVKNRPAAYDVEKVVEEAKEISRYVAYGNYDRDIGMTHRVVPFDALEKILKAGGVE